MVRFSDINHEIEQKRIELNQAGLDYEFDLRSEEILNLSIELDRLLNEYHK
ncbi:MULTISPECIES: aspartyl-phosphate phosphatase Spo0E family protein [Paenibacillus]|uniref:aspartyl-phosphate phosphatase Spo0E family protein n=1 Tax=Paenibacillus TaxID=44249 RepID=UPI0028D8EA6E|nr:aspartyl-phosphate phosphatase Spo0E family protein [Paenibacillus terrigena]